MTGTQQPPNDNGPSGREWGDLTREVAEIRHDLRTLKLNFDACGLSHRTGSQIEEVREQSIKLRQDSGNMKDDIQTMKTSIVALEQLTAEFSQFRSLVYFSATVVLVLAGAVAWLTDVVLKIAGD